MLVGGIDFKKNLGKDISFTKFKKLYAGKFKNFDIKKAYLILGGKIKKSE